MSHATLGKASGYSRSRTVTLKKRTCKNIEPNGHDAQLTLGSFLNNIIPVSTN